ncbi:MAG TPA: protein kinase [Kofleriaceae bacterium]|nr:protein kinase [Kofleriaceae bacterium]
MHRPPSEFETSKRAASVDPEDPAQLIGQIIDGRYRLTSLVGRGGMGAVFLAEHVTIRRPVAVKLLVPSLAAIPELSRRFQREAFAIGRIDHPNCVSVMDFGRLENGSLYLVMEYLPGRSLAEAIEEEEELSPRRSLHIIRHVLRGLGHAHQAGIVHRDVKPENVILIEHDGVPDFAKILDFGIARVVGQTPPDVMEEGEERLTQAGIAFGTPAYLSPEQAIGDPVDQRADLYSATVMLFEMMTGRPPFYSQDKLELLGMHATRPPPRLRDVKPDLVVPPLLDDLIATGLAKSPSRRFIDADQYIAAIETCLLERMDGDSGLLPVGATPADTGPVGLALPPPAGLIAAASVRRVSSLPTSTASDTPMRVVRRPARRSVWPALLALLVLAGGAAGAYWYFFLQPPRDVDLLAGLKSEAAERAERTLVEGDPGLAIQQLTQTPEALAGDAQAQLQLGNAHAARSEYEKALAAYSSALQLDPSLLSDERLRANLRLMIDDDGPVLIDAARILAQLGRDEDARARIVELAAARDRTMRRRAFALAEELGLGDRIDRLKSFTLDLQQETTCPRRRDAVTKLRALGDRRALEPLQEALARSSRSKRHKHRRDPNACLRQHAEDAVRYFESLAPPTPPDAAVSTTPPPG